MQINDRQIGTLLQPYVVAELSANHDGCLGRALDIITAAAEAGADALKFQCYDPIRLAEARGGVDKVITDGPWSGMSLGELYERAHTPSQWFPAMVQRAQELGITWFSSVFDVQSLRLMMSLDCPAYKVSSFDARNRRLIDSIARQGAPMIVSCGMVDDAEITGLIDRVHKQHGHANQIALLHCVSAYPTPLRSANLTRIGRLRKKHGVPIGFSDHTLGTAAAAAAVALGACIIEKHVTLDKGSGLDASFSLEPDELRRLVEEVNGIYQAVNLEEDVAPYRSLMVVT